MLRQNDPSTTLVEMRSAASIRERHLSAA